MASEIMLGFQWVIGLLGSDSTLAGFVPGAVHRTLAPVGTVPPYVVVSHQAGSDSTTMNGVRILVRTSYLIKVVGPADNTPGIVSAYSQIETLLGEEQGLRNQSTPGGFILSFVRDRPMQMDELVNGELWTNLGGIYKAEIERVS